MKIYLAAPIVNIDEEMKERIDNIKVLFSEEGEIYDPKEHGVPNAWGMGPDEWAAAIFALDVVAIDNCDWVIVCDFGRKRTGGTAWEAGYAFGKGKKILLIHMSENEEDDYSVMMRGCSTNYCYYKDIDELECLSLKFEKVHSLFTERGRVENVKAKLN